MSGDSTTGEASAPPGGEPAAAHLETLFGELSELQQGVESTETTGHIREMKQLLAEANERGLIDSHIRQLEVDDAAEAFVGSVIFASPLLIEDGVFDIATHLFETAVLGVPVFLLANTAFVVFMTYALLEWTGRNKEEADMLFGVIPMRVVMILVVSFLVAALLMTVWGRVGDWRPPAEAIARVNVIWTVGSLGAALGDILSDADTSPAVDDLPDAGETATGSTGDVGPVTDRVTDSELVESIHDQFDTLESTVESDEARDEIQRIRQLTVTSTIDDVFGDRIRKYTGRDIAEGFVGSIFFSIPFLVEDGVFDVAEYFLSFRIGLFPVFFLVNAAFVLLMISALVYWAGPQDVQVSRPIFGLVSRRLLGIALISYLTAAMLMTMWGRVGTWNEPVVAMARISVVWTVASFGAALGDILPGESSGADINDELSEFVESTRDEVTADEP